MYIHTLLFYTQNSTDVLFTTFIRHMVINMIYIQMTNHMVQITNFTRNDAKYL